MEPVIMVITDHIFRALEHEIRIMAEPDDIQYDHVPEIHDRPQQKATAKSLQKRRITVDVSQDQTEDDDEQNACAEFGCRFVLLRGYPVFRHQEALSRNNETGRHF